MCSVCEEGWRLQHEVFGESNRRYRCEGEHIYLLEHTDWPVLHNPVFLLCDDIFTEYGRCPHAWPDAAWILFLEATVTSVGEQGWVRCQQCEAAIVAAPAT